jgi:hypothetical protein
MFCRYIYPCVYFNAFSNLRNLSAAIIPSNSASKNRPCHTCEGTNKIRDGTKPGSQKKTFSFFNRFFENKMFRKLRERHPCCYTPEPTDPPRAPRAHSGLWFEVQEPQAFVGGV